MVIHTRKGVVTNFTAQVAAAVTDFKLVSSDETYYHWEGLSSDHYPACIVIDGPTVGKHNVTSTLDNDMQVGVRIIVDAESTFNDLRDLFDEVILAIDADVQLGGACIKCLYGTSMPPFPWPSEHISYIDAVFNVTYRLK